MKDLEHKADKSIANMTKLPTAQELNLENLSIKTAPGVTLKPEQEVVVGSVLDVRVEDAIWQWLHNDNQICSSSQASHLSRSSPSGPTTPFSPIP